MPEFKVLPTTRKLDEGSYLTHIAQQVKISVLGTETTKDGQAYTLISQAPIEACKVGEVLELSDADLKAFTPVVKPTA